MQFIEGAPPRSRAGRSYTIDWSAELEALQQQRGTWAVITQSEKGERLKGNRANSIRAAGKRAGLTIEAVERKGNDEITRVYARVL